MTKPRGRPPRDDYQLMAAAAWTLYLDPKRRPARVRSLRDVADLLLACPQPAVRAAVASAGRKRLADCLAPYRRDLLPPEWLALSAAADWAEENNVPARPLQDFASLAPPEVKFARTERRGPWPRHE
jgi:hypothetical protein